ncbi:hypothetical protein [Pseudomonas sp. CYM-20-01]|uniref:hypothetical protein n=1 Tax=Pseudomonas sp. CYM-20-01 TaxID=2870750 RepID=UPI0020C081B9|nr:hypothetical protein [Pseudomonas sp. CYM-20-01]
MGIIGSEWDDVFQSILKKCELGERACSLRNKTTMLQQVPLRAADMTKPSFSYLLAASSGLAANILLGVSSLYWRELNELTPQVLVAYRVLLSLLALAVIIGFGQGFRNLVKLNIRTLGLHCTASFLVAVNWGTFIWASLHGHVLESGFGYLLAPFLSITMGIFFYREKLRPAQTVSMLTIMAAAFAGANQQRAQPLGLRADRRHLGELHLHQKSHAVECGRGLVRRDSVFNTCHRARCCATWMEPCLARSYVNSGSVAASPGRRNIGRSLDNVCLRHRQNPAFPGGLISIRIAHHAVFDRCVCVQATDLDERVAAVLIHGSRADSAHDL